jgi:hypothetical protein
MINVCMFMYTDIHTNMCVIVSPVQPPSTTSA